MVSDLATDSWQVTSPCSETCPRFQMWVGHAATPQDTLGLKCWQVGGYGTLFSGPFGACASVAGPLIFLCYCVIRRTYSPKCDSPAKVWTETWFLLRDAVMNV